MFPRDRQATTVRWSKEMPWKVQKESLRLDDRSHRGPFRDALFATGRFQLMDSE